MTISRTQYPKSRAAARLVAGALVPLILIMMWELITRIAGSIFFPPPSDIFSNLLSMLFFSADAAVADYLSGDVAPSLARMVAGWGLAIVLGVAIGSAIGLSVAWSSALFPVLNFLRSTPGPALIPVFLVVLGPDDSMRVALIAFGAVWPVLLNTMEGVRGADPTQIATGRVFRLPPLARFFRIILPSAMPRIFAGMSVSLAIAMVLMVVSELTVALDGIGYQLQRAQVTFRFLDMWSGILLIALLGLGLTALFGAWERRSLAWYRAAQRDSD